MVEHIAAIPQIVIGQPPFPATGGGIPILPIPIPGCTPTTMMYSPVAAQVQWNYFQGLYAPLGSVYPPVSKTNPGRLEQAVENVLRGSLSPWDTQPNVSSNKGQGKEHSMLDGCAHATEPKDRGSARQMHQQKVNRRKDDRGKKLTDLKSNGSKRNSKGKSVSSKCFSSLDGLKRYKEFVNHLEMLQNLVERKVIEEGSELTESDYAVRRRIADMKKRYAKGYQRYEMKIFGQDSNSRANLIALLFKMAPHDEVISSYELSKRVSEAYNARYPDDRPYSTAAAYNKFNCMNIRREFDKLSACHGLTEHMFENLIRNVTGRNKI